jgi:electron transport complex protein RnfD
MSKEETPQQSATEKKSDTDSASAEGAGKAAKKAEAPRFILAASPFFLEDVSTPKIMHTVVMALMPAMAASIYFFGFRALLLLVICIASCMVTEAIFQRFRKRPITVYDGSAIITGALLALTLPPGFPIFGAILGSAFAISIGKQFFGGLGYNIFNPALLGRAFLQATYPVLITTWSGITTWASSAAEGGVDAVATATPLALMKFDGVTTPPLDLFFGNVAGSLGETSVIAILVGGLYLRYKGYVNWRLPLGYLGSLFVFGGIFWLIDPSAYPSPVFHICAGGAMLGAWFMVTDMVTSPTTAMGQWIFVIGAGFIAIIIRLFGGLPEGVMYSILLMNSIVPLLNIWTRPKINGEVK